MPKKETKKIFYNSKLSGKIPSKILLIAGIRVKDLELERLIINDYIGVPLVSIQTL